MWLKRFLLLFLLSTSLPLFAAEEDYDPFKEAMFLLKNDDLTRAGKVIDKMAEEEEESPRHHFLKGLLGYKTGRFADALKSLQIAHREGFKGHASELYLCEASLKLKEPKVCIEHLEKSADLSSEATILLGRSYQDLRSFDKAYVVLSKGLVKDKNHTALVQALVDLLMDQKLSHAAFKVLESLPKRSDLLKAENYMTISARFAQAKAYESALVLLEEARLRYPADPKVSLALAQTYVQKRSFLSAAQILQDLARQQPRYYLETAELFRRARAFSRALIANQFVPTEKERLQQRLIILLDMGSFDLASHMKADLSRLGLLDADEDIAYGLAFAFYKQGSFPMAEKLLSSITRADLLKKATWLRQSMETCSTKDWACVL